MYLEINLTKYKTYTLKPKIAFEKIKENLNRMSHCNGLNGYVGHRFIRWNANHQDDGIKRQDLSEMVVLCGCPHGWD